MAITDSWEVVGDRVQIGTLAFAASSNPDYPLSRDVLDLIAAAPDLCEALESILIAYEQDVTDDGGPTPTEVVKARAALAKARGEV